MQKLHYFLKDTILTCFRPALEVEIQYLFVLEVSELKKKKKKECNWKMHYIQCKTHPIGVKYLFLNMKLEIYIEIYLYIGI